VIIKENKFQISHYRNVSTDSLSTKNGFNRWSNVKNWHCYLKQRPSEANIFRILPLPFVGHLNVEGSYNFLFTRCFWSVDLRKKLRTVFNVYYDQDSV